MSVIVSSSPVVIASAAKRSHRHLCNKNNEIVKKVQQCLPILDTLHLAYVGFLRIEFIFGDNGYLDYKSSPFTGIAPGI